MLCDAASVLGRVDAQAGATIRFTLYGPDDATCTGTPASGPAHVQYPSMTNPSLLSPSFTPTRAGTYRWIATYSGDVNNAPATTACDDPHMTPSSTGRRRS